MGEVYTMASWNSSWRPPSSIQPAKGYAATHSSYTNINTVRAVANSPSPSGLIILEQTAGWDSQRILGEIFQGSAGRILAVPVPRSTHLTHLLLQPIPSAHIDPRKKTALMTLPIYPHYPLVVYRGNYFSVDQQNYDLIWNISICWALLNQVRAATGHVLSSSLEGDVSTFGQFYIFSFLFD